jgi:hypothetical protein
LTVLGLSGSGTPAGDDDDEDDDEDEDDDDDDGLAPPFSEEDPSSLSPPLARFALISFPVSTMSLGRMST